MVFVQIIGPEVQLDTGTNKSVDAQYHRNHLTNLLRFVRGDQPLQFHNCKCIVELITDGFRHYDWPTRSGKDLYLGWFLESSV